MAKILDAIKMSEPVKSTESPKAERNPPSVEEARNAALAFLGKMPDVRQVEVTKLAVMDSEKGGWEAEAELYLPNRTIKTLGLPVQREVLDCQTYLLRLDEQLRIVAYGRTDAVEQASLPRD